VSIYENNVNVFRPENIGTNKVKGIETNFKLLAFKKITLNGDFNYLNFKREGSFNEEIFDFSSDQWTGKLTTKYKINKALDLEVSAEHESQEKTVQGTISANTFANFGMRYKILDGKMVINLGIRDVFASRVLELTIDDDDFYLYSSRQRGRFVTLGFSYGFGKGEAMQYSGRRR
jgi:outer membrane receptor for ferrienterochelin and colicin